MSNRQAVFCIGWVLHAFEEKNLPELFLCLRGRLFFEKTVFFWRFLHISAYDHFSFDRSSFLIRHFANQFLVCCSWHFWLINRAPIFWFWFFFHGDIEFWKKNKNRIFRFWPIGLIVYLGVFARGFKSFIGHFFFYFCFFKFSIFLKFFSLKVSDQCSAEFLGLSFGKKKFFEILNPRCSWGVKLKIRF